MALHAQNIAIMAGAVGDEVETSRPGSSRAVDGSGRRRPERSGRTQAHRTSLGPAKAAHPFDPSSSKTPKHKRGTHAQDDQTENEPGGQCRDGCRITRAGAVEAADKVRVGVLTDMTGFAANSTGPGSVVAAKLAIEDFKAENPALQVELVAVRPPEQARHRLGHCPAVDRARNRSTQFWTCRSPPWRSACRKPCEAQRRPSSRSGPGR